MAKAVFGIAANRAQAESIIDTLQKAGFPSQDISVLFPNNDETQHIALEKQTKALEGAAAGAGTGGLIGGALGLLVGLGSFVIPGLGLLLAAGPILGALSGLGAGAAVGGLAGALVGFGIPEYEATRYEGQLKAGSILLAVHADDAEEVRRARAVLEAAGAKDIATTREAA
jgi:heat induced stress protein YflT